MTVTAAQRGAIEEVINAIITASPPRGKRHLSAIFMELVDRKEYPEYYEVTHSAPQQFFILNNDSSLFPNPVVSMISAPALKRTDIKTPWAHTQIFRSCFGMPSSIMSQIVKLRRMRWHSR